MALEQLVTVFSVTSNTFYHIFLTEQGKESIKLISDEFEKIEEQAFDGIAETDREAFMNMFARIYNNLKRKEEKTIE